MPGVYTPLKIRTKRDWRKTAVIIHTAAVAATVLFWCWTWGDWDPPILLWIFFLLVDFPLGWVTVLLMYLIDLLDVRLHRFVFWVILPGISFGVSGGLQLYWIVGRITRQNEPEPHKCAGCGYDLRGSLESGRCPECGSAFDADAITDSKLERAQPEK